MSTTWLESSCMILWSPILVTLISPILKQQHPSRTQGVALSVTILLQCGLGIKISASHKTGLDSSLCVRQKTLISQKATKKIFQGASFEKC